MNAAVQQFCFQGILQVVANVALAHGYTDGQWHHVALRLLTVIGGKGVLDHAHLGAVAVGDDHLMAIFNEISDGLGGVLHRGHLFGEALAQGVTAQGDDNAFGHSAFTSQ